ncbi:hypothetical protein IC006_0932 [Sulfuracidifex tepidarius]|uniref:Amino acid permease/ SLC12A domain-containing protein n=2 Tax=Sulfuracidifex tepidarius TaxID=1294262 RepID=A0A510DU19_9CREN|nr:APC family permease [Sulfuracidifex tepidarius]BBG23644.1 hypothetical protein IC006_0932 [Sulfuracidifex tepidarius]
MAELKRKVFHILDLVPLSTSSVAPAFSISAAYGVMTEIMGVHATMSVLVAFPFFLMASLLLRKLNKISPNAGASYHWGAKLVGKRYGLFQFWIVSLAYFLSLPPIVIPAGEYTLDLLYRIGIISYSFESSVLWDSIVGIAWVIVSAIPLILGAKPTAKLTEAFLAVELAVLVSFIAIGIYSIPRSINPFSPSMLFDGSFLFSPRGFLGLAATLVIVATILDGWEIDSYASEESQKPTQWPGLSGIAGLAIVFSIYMVTMPLMSMETPTSALSVSVDPLATWASQVIPRYVWVMDIAVISSTASSLWLTAYILSRVWYSAGREGILPSKFSSVTGNGSPWVAVVSITLLEVVVQILQLSSPSLQSFFGLVLTAAGAFLSLEFSMDALTITYLVVKGSIPQRYGAVSLPTALFMSSVVFLGILDAGQAFGINSSQYALVLLSLILPGLLFLLRNRKMKLVEVKLDDLERDVRKDPT